MRGERGSRSRLITSMASSTSAPNATRPKVTWSGAKPWVPTLMKRKLKPQTRERAAKRIGQPWARPVAFGGVAAVRGAAVEAAAVCSSAVGRAVVAGEFVVSAEAVGAPVAVLMPSTMRRTTLKHKREFVAGIA